MEHRGEPLRQPPRRSEWRDTWAHDEVPESQEIFAIQSEWVRDAADDYMREMSKLMEINSRIMSGMFGSLGQVGMPSAVEMPTSPVAHSAFETPASPVAHSTFETPALPEVRLGPETRFQPATRSSPARSTAKAETSRVESNAKCYDGFLIVRSSIDDRGPRAIRVPTSGGGKTPGSSLVTGDA